MRDAASLLGARAFSEGSLLGQPDAVDAVLRCAGDLAGGQRAVDVRAQILRKWGIWLLLAACLWLTWNLFAKADLAASGRGR
jgi:hypothetical protein